MLAAEQKSRECPRRECPRGECPFAGVLVLSAEIVDGRPRVLHLRRSRASWLDAQSLYYTLVIVTKKTVGSSNLVDGLTKYYHGSLTVRAYKTISGILLEMIRRQLFLNG